MKFSDFLSREGEKPLDHMVTNGGFCGIFRKIACVGDSLSSGELEAVMDGKMSWHDFYEYSWGQYLARDAGCKVYNFSGGGMSAKVYCEEFADSQDFWNVDYRAQAYILAMGVNDVTQVIQGNIEFGSIEDVCFEDYKKNKPTFAGYYAKIIQRYQEIQPKAKFFLMTMPKGLADKGREEWNDKHRTLLCEMAERFEHCYLLDFRKYAPEYDKEFYDHFALGGHLNAAGYRLTALMVESYIDYIIRHNMEDFKQIGFVGTPYHHENVKW